MKADHSKPFEYSQLQALRVQGYRIVIISPMNQVHLCERVCALVQLHVLQNRSNLIFMFRFKFCQCEIATGKMWGLIIESTII